VAGRRQEAKGVDETGCLSMGADDSWDAADWSGDAGHTADGAGDWSGDVGMAVASADAAANGDAGATDDASPDETAAATGTSARVEAYIEEQLGEYKRMFSEQRHGCWCGPGHTCEGEADDIDACCHHHDLNYDAAGVAAESMWSGPSLIKTQSADEALVSCLAATIAGPTWHGPAAVDYRALAMAIFGARAAAAEAVKTM
jgi:hypothetical protein